MAESRKLYELIEHYCTLDQIQDLLRAHKQLHPQEVHITGAKKREVVDHLRLAVDKHVISVKEVHTLLQDSEENGNQHILYFTPGNQKTLKMCQNAHGVAKRLWSNKWQDKMSFPRFDYIPDEYVWADFREKSIPGKPLDWIAKIYGLDTWWRFSKVVERKKVMTRHYKLVSERVVCIVRWNNPDVLEIRVPRSKARETIENRLSLVWDMLKLVLQRSQFQNWDLAAARFRILDEEHTHRSKYHLGDTNLLDSASGTATISPQTEEEDLLAPLERRKAIQIYLKHGGHCRQLVVTWKPNRRNPLPREVRTVIGGFNSHEVIIPAQTTQKAVDYVTNQFRYFN